VIFVAGRKMEKWDQFTEVFQMICTTIVDGEEWLTWALSAPSAQFWLSVRGEGELLSRMLEGLHGTALIKLNGKGQGLWVHPMKLIELGNDKDQQNLKNIINAEKGFKSILKDHGLMARSDLLAGLRFLADLGVNDDLVFQIMTLADQIKIARLQQEVEKRGTDGATAKEAADFALQYVQTPAEFSAGFRFYLAVQKKFAGKLENIDARRAKTTEIWELLSPFCNGLLETFAFSREVYWESLAGQIKACLLSGFKLGFLSKAAALGAIMNHTPYYDQKDTAAESIVADYLAVARQTIEMGDLTSINLSQDGLSRSYVFSRSGVSSTVAVDAWGIVTLTACTGTPVQ
jgi:hypothetical protein